MNQVATTLDDEVTSYRKEIVGYLEEMVTFRQKDTVEILQLLGAYSARASYMRNRVVRSGSKRAETFRVKELDPFLNEVDRQFKVWSRVASVMTAEWEMSQR